MDPNQSRPNVLLIAEDDDDEFLLTQDALQESKLAGRVIRVRDGEEAMAYLLRQSPYDNPKDAPRPTLILLDLNMPKKDGRETLKEIRNHPDLRALPVVILTNSNADYDVAKAYTLGVNTYIRKPSGFPDLVNIISEIKHYWFHTAKLPPHDWMEKDA